MINNKSTYFAFALLVASSLFWSGNFFTGKIASLYDLSPFKLSFLSPLLRESHKRVRNGLLFTLGFISWPPEEAYLGTADGA